MVHGPDPDPRERELMPALRSASSRPSFLFLFSVSVDSCSGFPRSSSLILPLLLGTRCSVYLDIQRSTWTRMCSVRWNVINVGQIEIGVLCWNLFSLFGGMFADKFHHGSLTSLILLVLFPEE